MLYQNRVARYQKRNIELLIEHVEHFKSYAELAEVEKVTRQRVFQRVVSAAKRLMRMDSDDQRAAELGRASFNGAIAEFCRRMGNK